MDEERERDEDNNLCPGCGNDRMAGHKLTCTEPLADAVEQSVEELLG